MEQHQEKPAPRPQLPPVRPARKPSFGSTLRNLHRSFDFSLSHIDRTLLFLLLTLVLFGLVMVTSTASYTIIRRGQESIFGFIGKQILLTVLGFGAMWFMASFDYHRLNWSLLLGLAPVVILLNLLPRLVGTPVNGAYRWLDLGFTTLQPSEIAKYYIAVLTACLMTFPKTTPRRTIFYRYLLVWSFVGVFILIIAKLQSNLSTSAILAMAAFLVILVSQVPMWWNIFPFVGGGLAGVVLVRTTGYRLDRMMGFFHPFSDPTGNTLQLVQSLYALSMGGLLGRGLGNSRFKAFWLPYAENDFIFAIICEELGLLGGLTVLSIFTFLVLTGLKIGRQAKDSYGKLLSVGIVSIIGLQAAINMAVVMGAFPVTGVPLPFISAGGTSMIVNLAAMGILLNISKQKVMS
ncbi:MAG: FtsW/RodA/SpoVE family cell cycle protein [Clostridiaceae bacterium]